MTQHGLTLRLSSYTWFKQSIGIMITRKTYIEMDKGIIFVLGLYLQAFTPPHYFLLQEKQI